MMQPEEPPEPVEARGYEPPRVTDVGNFEVITEGQYSRSISDDSDAGGYWEE